MASSKEYMYFISEQLSESEEISFKAMMGEYIICYRGKIVGGNIQHPPLPYKRNGQRSDSVNTTLLYRIDGEQRATVP